jgi:hypothetical protein
VHDYFLHLLPVIGFLVQESYHPMHEAIGGMAITHMASVLHLANSEGTLSCMLHQLVLENRHERILEIDIHCDTINHLSTFTSV